MAGEMRLTELERERLLRLQTEAELARERLETASLRFKAALSDVTAQRGLTGAFTLDLNQGLLSPSEGE